MLADLEDDEAKDTARKFGKFTAEILLIVAAEKGITKATTALKESAKTGKLSKVSNAWAKTGQKADDFVDDLVKGNVFISKVNPYALKPTHSQTLSKNKFNKLLEEIKQNGIQETIKYVEHDGQKYVVDGHHRLLAAKNLGLVEVPIEKVELPYLGYKTVDDLLWYE